MSVATQPTWTSAEVSRLRDRFVAPAFFQSTSVVVDRAEGACVFDPEGRRYLDFTAGIAVLNVGHNHPEVVAAVKNQIDRCAHIAFHVAAYDRYVQLAQELDRLFPGSSPTKSIFVNSGAEAVENAIKVARVATDREYVIGFQNAFHGRTMTALGATGKTKPSRLPFLRSMPPNVLHTPYPYPYRPLATFASEEDLVDLHLRLLERMLETQIAPEAIAAILVAVESRPCPARDNW